MQLTVSVKYSISVLSEITLGIRNSPCVASPNSTQGGLGFSILVHEKAHLRVLIVVNLFLKTLGLVAPTVC